MERQAEKARTYLKKKDELKTYDINMFLLETQRLKEQIESAESKLSIVKAELDDANVQYDNMKLHNRMKGG